MASHPAAFLTGRIVASWEVSGRRTLEICTASSRQGRAPAEAAEDVAGDNGYVFWALPAMDAFHALGELRERIPKFPSNRHLAVQHGRMILTHDRLQEHISYGEVVVDGVILPWQLAELTRTYVALSVRPEDRELSVSIFLPVRTRA